ncbi:MAG: hypothetical protein EBS05_05300 [Proteobacteria bacterium]|nr:hypothetical protein [Pseudomonadota bacterium]
MNRFLPTLKLLLAGYTVMVHLATATAQPATPVAHWRFDDQPGSTTVADSAGTFTGTLSPAGASIISGGRAGNCLLLDRNLGGYVDMGNVLPLTNTSFSLIAWVRLGPSETADTRVIDKDQALTNGYYLGINSAAIGVGAANRASFFTGSTNPPPAVSTTIVNDGNWHQIVSVFRLGGTTTIYVDGAPFEGTAVSGPIITNTARFLIGGSSPGGTPTASFNGSIDDVQVYNRALSDGEISYLFSNPGIEITSTTVNGTIRNAINGQGIAGATVQLNGSVTTVSSVTGQFTFTNVPVSTVSLTATATGFVTYSNNFALVPTPNNTIGFAMSPSIANVNSMRLVLNWNSTPSDLDSHLTTPTIAGVVQDVSWTNRGSLFVNPFASLDFDVTSGFGPETITITNFFAGTYHYYIANYSGQFGDTPLTQSGATAQLYGGSGLIATVRVPTTGVGLYWYVARIDGASKFITIVNQITNRVPVVAGAPSFTSAPQSVVTNAGATVVFSVSATGNPTLTYQWRLNGINIPGATSATLSLFAVQAANAGQYDCVVANSLGSVISLPATLTVNTLTPVIITPPQSIRVPPGKTVIFSVLATGPGPLTYQWRFNGMNLLGATGPTLTLNNVQLGNAGNYTVIVGNPFGSTISLPGNLDVLTAPSLPFQPADVVANVGDLVNFSVSPTGSVPFDYQWLHDGIPIPGATNSAFTLVDVQFIASGNYSVTVSNAAGGVLSSNASLTISSPPIIITQPQPRTVSAGQPVSLSATVIGSPPLIYQWQQSGTNVPGATNASLARSAAQVTDRGLYTLTISNDYGSITSAPAFIAVHPLDIAAGWTHQAGGPGADVANACASDANGNFFMVGYFSGTASFGTNTLISLGFNDIFVAKFANNGKLLWVNRAGGPGYDTANAVAVDGAGNCYVTGAFEGIADFGGITLTNLDSTSFTDIFVAKYDPNGNVVWATSMGAVGVSDTGQAIAVDASQNVIVAGGGALDSFAGNPVPGNGRILLAAMDNLANPLWAQSSGLAGNAGVQDAATGVGLDTNGNIYVVGNFQGPQASFGTVTLTNRGFSDAFLAKYNSGGTLQSVLQIGGPGSDRLNALAVDAAGNAYVAGHFTDDLSLGTVGPRTPAGVSTALVTTGQADSLVAKFDPAGNLVWTQTGGGTGPTSARGIVLDAKGNVQVTGYFAGSVAFGTNALSSSGGTLDIFTASYSPAGQPVFAQSSGGPDLNGDFGNGIAVDPAGNLFVVGQFNGTTSLGANQLTSSGGGDVFAARFNAPQSNPPQMNYGLSNGQLILSWPVSALGWRLQLAPSSPLAAGWNPAPLNITVVGSNYVVVVPLSGGNGFFRLVH